MSGPGIGSGFTASSVWNKKGSCQAQDAHMETGRAWCARTNNGMWVALNSLKSGSSFLWIPPRYFLAHQWLQLELGPPTTVTGILTQGRGDTGRRQWVTSYTVSYSNDSSLWYPYKETNHRTPKASLSVLYCVFCPGSKHEITIWENNFCYVSRFPVPWLPVSVILKHFQVIPTYCLPTIFNSHGEFWEF